MEKDLFKNIVKRNLLESQFIFDAKYNIISFKKNIIFTNILYVFSLILLIFRGGYAAVWLAYSKELKKDVAVK